MTASGQPQVAGDLLSRLNEPQRAAVLHDQGPMMVFAGAGSGKTRVITTRIAHLISRGVAPWEILAMTFTNKAAAEMKQRVVDLTPEGRRVFVSTFHASCARWLREFAGQLGYSSDFVIYDDKDSTALLKNLLVNKCSKKDLANFVAKHKVFISWCKMKGLLPHQVEPYLERSGVDAPPAAAETYKAYQQALSDAEAMDFGDLLLNVLLLLRRNEAVRNILQNRFRYIMVDEFQDTNVTQFELICRLSASHRNVMVVGDDDQSIYSWRGANPSNISDFKQHFTECQQITLGQNYRCTGNIVKSAAALIGRNTQRTPKNLFTDNDAGETITLLRESDNEMEALTVAETIKGEAQLFRYIDTAVFYRTNAQSRQLEESLSRYNIPYTIYGSLAFYERMEVKDLMAYLRLVVNPKDNISLSRIINVPPRGIGKKAFEDLLIESQEQHEPLLETLRRQAAANKPRVGSKLASFAELYDQLAKVRQLPLDEVLPVLEELVGYKAYLKKKLPDQFAEKIENIHELGAAMAAAHQRDPSMGLGAWLESVSLNREENTNQEGTGVTLMTLHMAKGLEFDRVYIVGVEDGLLPHQSSQDDPLQLEEERRLLYVGITRARQKLTMIFVDRRQSFNQVLYNQPSRFLAEIPKDCIDGNWCQQLKVIEDHDDLTYEYVADGLTLESLRRGAMVFHPTYGRGNVRDVEEVLGIVKVMVEFDDFGMRKIRPSQLSLVKS